MTFRFRPARTHSNSGPHRSGRSISSPLNAIRLPVGYSEGGRRRSARSARACRTPLRSAHSAAITSSRMIWKTNSILSIKFMLGCARFAHLDRVRRIWSSCAGTKGSTVSLNTSPTVQGPDSHQEYTTGSPTFTYGSEMIEKVLELARASAVASGAQADSRMSERWTSCIATLPAKPEK